MPDFYLSSATFKDNDNGNVPITAIKTGNVSCDLNISNTSQANTITALCIAALYNGAQLVDIKYLSQDIASGTSPTITLGPLNVVDSTNAKIKLFVWKDFITMIPLLKINTSLQ